MTLRFLTAGESHGPALLAILDGLPAGLNVSQEFINRELQRRQRGYGSGSRMKIEQDKVRVLGGILEGVTTGAPIGLMIMNKDHQKWKGKEVAPFTVPRPGHVDLNAAIKYGYCDLRPGLERASARETAARVAIGAICKQLLMQFNIKVGGYIVSLADIKASLEEIPLKRRFKLAEQNEVRCPDQKSAIKMIKKIDDAVLGRNTLGGVVEILILDVPPGLGTHVQWDRRLDARLGAAILSVQAIKGVEFGNAFENTKLKGTQAQDQIRLYDNKIIRESNNAGGFEGGITTGEPIIIRAAMKPIATTLKPQRSVDLFTGEEVNTKYERSDFCPVPRAVPILEAMASFVIADALLDKLGGDNLDDLKKHFKMLRESRLEDLSIDGGNHKFWI
jgi:chorismate synthase